MKQWQHHITIALFYGLVSFLLLHQPVFHMATHLAGGALSGGNTTDYFHAYWNYWWIGHALATGQDIYSTGYVFAPHTSTLAYHTLAVFWYPLWALVEPLAGRVAAMTSIYWVAFTLSGLAMYALLRRAGVLRGLALVGGVMLQLSPMLWSAAFWSNVNLFGWFWLPLLILVWDWVCFSARRPPSEKKTSMRVSASEGSTPLLTFSVSPLKGLLSQNVLISAFSALTVFPVAGRLQPPAVSSTDRSYRQSPTFHLALSTFCLALLLWAMILMDVQYPLFAAFVVVPYGLWTLWRARNNGARLRLVGQAMAAVGLALGLLWLAGPLRPLLAADRSGFTATPAASAVAIPFPLGYIWRIDQGVPLGGVILPLVLLAGGAALWRKNEPPRRQEKEEELNHRGTEDTERKQRAFPFNLALSTSNLQRSLQGKDEDLTTEAQRTQRGSRGLAVELSTLHSSFPAPTFWLMVALLPLLLSAGVSITMGGVTIRLPYGWLHELLGGQFRYPERFGPVFLIPALLFALMTLTWLLRGRRSLQGVVSCGLLLLVMADARLYRSLPIQPLPREYSFYEAMGREPYDYVVIEVPTGASTGESLVGEQRFAALMWYGQMHGKRMVNGHLSRADVNHFYPMRTDDPLLAWLGQRRFLEPEQVEAELREIIPAWPVGFIVVHQDMIGRDGPTPQEIIGYFNRLDELLCPVWVEGDAVVYRTTWHPAGCPPRTPEAVEPGVFRIDIGSSGDERFLGWGWHYPEVVGGSVTWRWLGEYSRTQVYFDLPPGDYRVTLAAQAFYEPCKLWLSVNGVPLLPDELRVVKRETDCTITDCPVSIHNEGLQTVSFHLPAALVSAGDHLTLTLDYDGVTTPAEVGQGSDTRKLAVAVDWIEFHLNESN